MFYVEFKLGNQWYSFQERGKDVCFSTEQEARAYLVGVAGETRVVKH